MPKELLKLVAFHGGLNTHSDARDIADNELADAVDVMVDHVGKIRYLGSNIAHDAPANGFTGYADNGVIQAGYGLFVFSHDRIGAEDRTKLNAYHTGGDHSTVMTDSNARFVVDGLIGGTIHNITDGSSGLITDNNATTVTVGSLSGGSDNSWDTASNDKYYISVPETGDDYLALYDDHDGQVWIYSRRRDTWDDQNDSATSQEGVIDIGTGSGAEVNFFYADGALRISDGAFGAGNTNKWYGYVERTHFTGLAPGGLKDIYSNWLSVDQEIAAPTRGLSANYNAPATAEASGGTGSSLIDNNQFSASWDSEIVGHTILNDTQGVAVACTAYDSVNEITTDGLGSGNWNGDEYTIHPPAGTGFNLYITSSGSGGTIPAGTYEFATTFIYDANLGEPAAQESLPYRVKNHHSGLVLGDNITLRVTATTPYSGRISGGRIYTRIYGSDDDWQMLAEISLTSGVRKDSSTDYVAWQNRDTTSNSTTTCLETNTLEIDSLSPLTYEVLTGVPQDTVTTTAQYKTAIVANRMCYIGNIKQNGIVYGDAMIKSPVNKFDIYPISRIIEASVRDGDNIIKLEEYADRILQFKKNKMHLINISQEIEFLEDTFMYKGIGHPAAVAKTDFGIVWANTFGCYLYDGQRVSNLLEKKGRQVVSQSDWETFLSGNKPMVGYLPKKRQIIVVDSIDASNAGKIYMYDMVTQSWTIGHDGTFEDQVKTNFVVDWNGDLVHCHTSAVGTPVKWSDTSEENHSSSNISIKTKDFDFGHPNLKKQVHKVYVTYKTGILTTGTTTGSATNKLIDSGKAFDTLGVVSGHQVGNTTDGLSINVTGRDSATQLSLSANIMTSGETYNISAPSNILVKYGVDGDNTISNTFADGTHITSGKLSQSDISDNIGKVDGWQVAELIPSNRTYARNIYTFQLHFYSDGASYYGFEINDITIVYRLMGKR